MYLILVYDIDMTIEKQGARALRNVFKTCKKYLLHIQNSVFEGELDQAQIEKLKIELKKYLRRDKDSCIMFFSRNNHWMEKEFITLEDNHNEQII
jgi:CRISPR-associated protein Cas2